MKLLSIFLVAAPLLSGIAWCAPSSGLYEVELPVSDQSAAARSAALGDALHQVLVKVSGQSALATTPALKEALRNPSRYVQQYSYRPNEGADAAALPLLLGVTYESRAIDQLLQEAGMPHWNSARPLTIVWLAVEQGNQRILVGARDRGLVRELLTKAAQRRGLPLRLPLLDTSDQARVQATDLWSDLHDPIIQASQRYEAQAVLVGRLGPAGGGRWQVRWTLYQGGSSQRWNQSGDKVEPLVAYGIDAATDTLAANQVKPTDPAVAGGAMYWVVKEVRDMRSHRRVMDYLESLRGVTSVQPEQVNSDSIRLRITTSSGEAALRQQLSFDNRLLPLDAAMFASADSASLIHPDDRVYRLAP